MVVPNSNYMLDLTSWLLPLSMLFILPSVWAQGDGSCQCGVKNVQTSNDYIVGGQDADKQEYPWMVAIVDRGSTDPWCGGSLITKRHVLTAAHCFDNDYVVSEEDIQVLLGFHSIYQADFERHDVSNIDNHKKWHDPDVDYDISILTIQPSVRGSFFTPVCLPADTNTKYVGQEATATGWGRLSTNGDYSPVLMEVDVTVTSDKFCKAKYRNAMDNSHICAIAPGKDTCGGDSGGPLVVKENGRWTLVGVVNFGHIDESCAKPGIPGVYARVTEVMEWIRKRTNGAYNSACQRMS